MSDRPRHSGCDRDTRRQRLPGRQRLVILVICPQLRKAADCIAFHKVDNHTKERAQWRGVPLIGCLIYWVRASGAENPCTESLQRLPPGLGSNGTLHAQCWHAYRKIGP